MAKVILKEFMFVLMPDDLPRVTITNCRGTLPLASHCSKHRMEIPGHGWGALFCQETASSSKQNEKCLLSIVYYPGSMPFSVWMLIHTLNLLSLF
ncbi:Diacylglycerol lipase-beta [Manis javanica]|nr:Diacylglycerol lipase-beta [Manis javanica]